MKHILLPILLLLAWLAPANAATFESLTPATQVNDTDIWPVVQSPGSSPADAKYTALQFKNYVLTNVPLSDLAGAPLSITSGKVLTVTNTLTLSGTDGSTLNVGAGGTLGSAAFTATGAYDTNGAAATAQSSAEAASLPVGALDASVKSAGAAAVNSGSGALATVAGAAAAAPVQSVVAGDGSITITAGSGGSAGVYTIVLSGTLESNLALNGHVITVASAGDAIAWLGSSTLIGTDSNGNPYLQANGSVLPFSADGTVFGSPYISLTAGNIIADTYTTSDGTFSVGAGSAELTGNTLLYGIVFDVYGFTGSSASYLGNDGAGHIVWTTLNLAAITDMSASAQAANAVATNTSGGLVTQTGGDARYVQQSSTVANPTPTVTGGGSNPFHVYQYGPTITWTSMAGSASQGYRYYTATFFINGSGSAQATQSILVCALPFIPQNEICWTAHLINSGATDSNIAGEIRPYYADSGNITNPTSSPAGCDNGKSPVSDGDPFFTLTFGTAAITCAAGDTLTLCTSVAGTTPTGGSLFTFTAESAVSSSDTVDIAHITGGTNTPTTDDTIIYDVTTATSYTTSYVKNSATNTSAWPREVLFPSVDGSSWDINYFGSSSYLDAVAFTLSAD